MNITMTTKVLFLLAILCLHQMHAFVLDKRSSNQLADALRVIQTQKRRLSEKEQAEKRSGYYGDGFGLEDSERMGYGGLGGIRDSLADSKQDQNALYEDYEQLGPDAMKLLEYYYDLGSRTQDLERDESTPVENRDDVTEVDQREIRQLLGDDKDKKNIDWTPKALGFEGLKHKRGGSDVTDDSANQETGEETGSDEGEGGNGAQSQLTDEEVNQLLNDAEDAEVKSVAKEVQVQDINGEKTVSGKEVTDILKDADNDSKKEEIILEKEIPPTKINDLNKELVVDQQLIGAGGASMKQKRAGGFLEQAMQYQPDEVYGPTEADLLRECLIKYIELEDRENTALAEALNWATKAQYDQTDAYIPMQVDYLRKAVGSEATLSNVRRQCFQLANQIDKENELINDLEDEEELEEEGGFPLEDDSSDVIDDEPIIDEGEFLPDGESDMDTENNLDEEMTSPEPRFSKEELADYITNELMDLLARKQDSLTAEEGAAEEGEGDDQWMDGEVDDTTPGAGEEEQTESDWQLNPFLRELILRYKEGKLDMNKRADEDLEDFEDYELPGEDSDLQSVSPYTTEDQTDSFIDTCPAVEELTDNCAYARALGWSLDAEAVELCNRHLLCYLCGSEHSLSANVCDKGYLGEAYTSCEGQADTAGCMEQADLLFELMYKTHPYSPGSGPRYSCKAQCTLDYITGNWGDK